MRATSWIARGALVMVLGCSFACGRTKPAAGSAADGGVVDMVMIADHGPVVVDLMPAGDGGLASCLEQPNELPRAPSGGLPCELIPPGLVLPGLAP